MQKSEIFEGVYRLLVIEFQSTMKRHLNDDELNFIKWIARKACEEYIKL